MALLIGTILHVYVPVNHESSNGYQLHRSFVNFDRFFHMHIGRILGAQLFINEFDV